MQSPLSNISRAMFSQNETSDWKFISNNGRREDFVQSRLLETIVFFSFSIIQCALLHPIFEKSVSARWLRLSLGPLTIGWWLCYPFRSTVLSCSSQYFFLGSVTTAMAFKSIEWTFAIGPYHLRERKNIKGVPIWEKETTDQQQKPKSKSFDWAEFSLWTFLSFTITPQRGLRWSWGPPGKGNTNSFAKSVLELIRLQLVMLVCLAFLLSSQSQDRGKPRLDPTAALLNLGFQKFPGINLLAGWLHSTAFMFAVSSGIEFFSLLLILPTYLLYPLAKTFGLSTRFTELVLNPVNYPPQFGSLFTLSSVSHFWGKSWHQKLRRIFLFCGGKPAISLARYFGASEKVQKIFGVIGVFTISGIIHEYPLYTIPPALQPEPRVLFKTFPGSFLFFFVQSFGIILEQFIIPRIPKILGGGRLWTLSFLLLTAPLFSHDVCQPGGMMDEFAHLFIKWTGLHFFVPVKNIFASRIL